MRVERLRSRPDGGITPRRVLPRGFTMIELMIVVVLVGTLTFFSLPKFSGLQERSRVRSARQELEAAIATARAAAIQKGRTAQFRVTGNRMWVMVATATGTDTLLPVKPLDSLYNVTLTATDSIIAFDMRGFARLGTSATFKVVGNTRRDSVCVTATGQIMPRRCSL